MDFLITDIELVSPGHSLHRQKVHIGISQGQIAHLGQQAPSQSAKQQLDGNGLCISPGWFDLGAVLSEPGFEHKEDLESFCLSAARGGFTDVATFPNTQPPIQSKESIHFLKEKTRFAPIRLHAIAAITKGTAGEELSEILDLHHAGAVAFSDGLKPLQDPALIGRALLYVKSFGGLFIHRPLDLAMAAKGQMHEGIASTRLGMRGIPALAEEMAIRRDLALVAYHDARIHFSRISTAGAVELIREAKQKGLKVTCDIASYQLSFTDEDLATFDTNLKVNPPFRSKADAAALWQGLADGTIDVICSAHQPQDQESKELEFDLADFGIINLETAYAAINTARPAHLPADLLIEKMAINPRKLLGLDNEQPSEGQQVSLSIFDENAFWSFKEEEIHSPSKNSPFTGKMLKGKALGTINGKNHFFSEELKARISG